MTKLTKADKAKQADLYSKMVSPEPYKEPVRLSGVTASDIPDIKNWEVGKTYDIKLKMKMTSKSEGGYDGKQPLRAEFQLGSEDESKEPGNMMDDDEDD